MNKLANNILELLLDPTKIPVRNRLYFRNEEVLDNSAFDKAKQDSVAAYGAQRQNADFYPSRNRQQPKREAAMDRRTLIASFDILSKQFQMDHPIATDLRTMAVAVSKMEDSELDHVLAAEASGCMITASDGETTEDTEMLHLAVTDWIKHVTQVGKKWKKDNPGAKYNMKKVIQEAKKTWKKDDTEDDKKSKKADDAAHDESTETPEQEAAESVETQKAEREKGQHAAAEWGKQADAAVVAALVEILPKQAGKKKGPGKPDGTGPMSGTPACPENPGDAPAVAPIPSVPAPMAAVPVAPVPAVVASEPAPVAPAPEVPAPAPEAKKPEPTEPEQAPTAAVVDTSMLATAADGTFEGIELSGNGTIDDDIVMSAEEAARLASVLNFDVTQGMDQNDKVKLHALLNNK